MNDPTIEEIARELDDELRGRRFGRIFPLSRSRFAIDLRLPDSQYLFISIEPAEPRAHLIKRRMRDLEKAAGHSGTFVLYLRKKLAGAEVLSIGKLPGERVLMMRFAAEDEFGGAPEFTLVIQLTGRSANILLLDANSAVLESAKETVGDGQEPGTRYTPPVRPGARAVTEEAVFPQNGAASLSEALDVFYLERERERKFKQRSDAARRAVAQEITKRRKLAKKLKQDLDDHGDAERWKRLGDLILANLSTARRDRDKIIVTDYFDENAPEIEIEADNNLSLTGAAEKFFKRYTKARNASVEIERRLDELGKEIAGLETELSRIDKAITDGDEDAFAADEKEQKRSEQRPGAKEKARFAGARCFTSSDGFEILVGKKAVDNDQLTFKVAKSLDTWLHAADYPGSHVVIRNPNRKEVPPTTLIEAAELAAFYSSGKSQPKAAVHYTQKKFVNKPRGAAPGLVSLASFKTILVEPRFPDSVSVD